LLKPYRIKSKSVRIGELHRKGYLAEDFYDSWNRYLSRPPLRRDKRDNGTNEQNPGENVPDVPDVPDEEGQAETDADPFKRDKRDKRDILYSKNNDVPNVPDVPPRVGTGCPACDGQGCPHCTPERFGLPPKKK
jgi:hypothetical protein